MVAGCAGVDILCKLRPASSRCVITPQEEKVEEPLRYYVIRDRKANASNKVFPSSTHGTAIRETADGVRDNEHLRRNAGDFILRYVGDLDEVTDTWNLEGAPSDVVEVAELVES